MLKRLVFSLFLSAFLMFLAACGSESGSGETDSGDSSSSDSSSEETEELVMGFIPSQDAAEIATTAEPLEEYLSEELGRDVRAEVMVDFSGLIEAMRTQQVDIGFLNPFGFVQAEDRADVEVILKSIRYGEDSYVAQYSVPADSDIESIEDLVAQEGLVWAYPDALSTSGYLFPAKQMMDMGVENLDEHFQGISVGGHDNAIMQLIDGQADFATTFDDARDSLAEEFPDVYDNVRVIGHTDPIPNDTISVRSELPDELKQDIEDAFMSINDNEEMLQVMNEIYTWDGIAEAESSDYDIVREVYAEFENDLEE